MKAFIDKHRDAFEVEPLCKVLQVSPSAYRHHAALLREPHRRCARAKRDEMLKPQIQRVWQANMQVYGADKVWRQLARERRRRGSLHGRAADAQHGAARRDARQGRAHHRRRCRGDMPAGPRHRRIRPAYRGLASEQFDAHGPRSRCAEQALYARQPERDGSLVCHSDRGSQYVSIHYSQRLAEAGIEPSVGSRGDSYDNALAETINGLYKAELIHRRAPWKTREAVEFATLEWVSWFNHQRLLEPIGYIPPAKAEANYYRQRASQTAAVAG